MKNPTDAPMQVFDVEVEGRALSLATVNEVHQDGAVSVTLPLASGAVRCEVLQCGARLCLAPGDAVLVWQSESTDGRCVILGRVGPAARGAGETTTGEAHVEELVPAEMVIEAKHSLTLRVGEGSITIREDGKILIKGKDLVSHAKRLNRIRGGSVQIN